MKEEPVWLEHSDVGLIDNESITICTEWTQVIDTWKEDFGAWSGKIDNWLADKMQPQSAFFSFLPV